MILIFKLTSFSNRHEITKNFTKKHPCLNILILFFICFAYSLPGLAQLPNEAFEFRRPLVPADTQMVKLGVYLLGYNKNNEYFNKIADGYTLFGMQAIPYLSYQASEKLRIDAGMFARKDFGNNGFVEVKPLMTIRYEQGPVNVLFGTLEGSLNHRLIEPMYDFERVMVNRLEEGLQFLYERPKTFLDVWINWEKMIYAGSPEQEEVSGGISYNRQLFNENGWRLQLPLQFVAYHKGGQIDINPDPLVTHVNAAGGFELVREWDSGLIRSLSFQPYGVWFRDFSHRIVIPYEQGGGWYLNLSAATKHFITMLSYWEGKDFVGIKSGALYQSVSTTFKYPDYTQDVRRLLILRFMLQVPITKDLEVSTRFEPYYDFGHEAFEFSHGMYLNYKTNFNLFRIRKERTTKP